jgi:anti-sigma B factor antagonist
MNITERQVEHAIVLDITGSIAGPKAADAVDMAVRQHARSGARLLVANLARVPSIDLAGLGALVHAHLTMTRGGGAFRIACLTKRIHDLVVITRLVTVIDTFDGVDDAVGDPVPVGRAREQAARLSETSLAPIQRFLRRA